jgi:hypothetical protein
MHVVSCRGDEPFRNAGHIERSNVPRGLGHSIIPTITNTKLNTIIKVVQICLITRSFGLPLLHNSNNVCFHASERAVHVYAPKFRADVRNAENRHNGTL